MSERSQGNWEEREKGDKSNREGERTDDKRKRGGGQENSITESTRTGGAEDKSDRE